MKRFQLVGAFVIAAFAMIISLSWSDTASAASRAEGQAYAIDYCNTVAASHGYQGLGDYVWPSASDGGNTIVANLGDSYATIKINVTGLYCKGYNAPSAGSNYWTNVGGVSGAFNPYPNNGANNVFDDSQLQSLNIAGWGEGWHTVCTDFKTWMTAPTLDSRSVTECNDIYLKIIYPWATDGKSQVGVDKPPYASTLDTAPGHTVTWNHGIWNTTPYGTDWIKPAVNRSGFSGADAWLNGNMYPWSGAGFSLGPWGSYWFGNNTGNYNNNTYFMHVVTQDDVGAGFGGKAAICQSVSWGPWHYNDGSWKGSSPACVRVPYNFSLTTRVDMNTAVTEPGTAITPISPYIMNAGPTKSYDDTGWQVSKMIIAPGKPIPGAATTNNPPCAYYNNGCTSMGTGSGTYNPGDSLVGQIASYTVEDVPIGTRICFALSVNKHDTSHNGANDWYHGAPTCVMVGKKPKVQVWGGDVATRAGINVSLTQKTTVVYGSWVEYGAFSVGPNINFASGAGLSANPAAQGSNAQASWSKLTFANVDATKNPRFGQYYTSASAFRQLPTITQYFTAMSSGAPAFVGNKPSDNTFATGGPVQVRTAGDLTLHKDMLPKGRSVVIVSSGRVTIDGDLTYDNGSFNTVSDIPQLVIIARDINITAAVQNVDAWLIATDATDDTTGIINTCSDGPASLTGNDCNSQLTIHGPVEARQLLLRRTAGSGVGQPASGDPAELIDMRADVYLWAQQVAAGAGKAQTVYTTELPPRF